MDSYDQTTANWRYKLLASDSRQLYRLFNKSQGVNVEREPQFNIDDWMNPSSPAYRREIHEAIFYYAARSKKEDRLKVCIATEEMNEAAWKYGHQSQIILDGTFGVCSSRMLLFISMAIDEEGKGVPLAFFLFSAPTGTKATHAGYNTAVLRELITQWRDQLSRNKPFLFTPLVAISDCDTRERTALQDVWPQIWLLLCKFHLRQCWTNKRKALKLTNGGDFWKEYINGQLLSLEAQ